MGWMFLMRVFAYVGWWCEIQFEDVRNVAKKINIHRFLLYLISRRRFVCIYKRVNKSKMLMREVEYFNLTAYCDIKYRVCSLSYP